MGVLSKTDRDALNRIHLLFNRNLNETKEFIESLAIYVYLEHLEGREVVIPYLGRLTLEYEGDVVEKRGKKAVVKSVFVPSEFIIRVIGQAQDGVRTDIDDILLKRIESVFQRHEEAPDPSDFESPPLFDSES